MAYPFNPLPFPSRVSIATPLVPLAAMKDHLRITDTAHDADIIAKSAQAQDAVLDYLTRGADPSWTETTVPLPVQAAIMRLTAFFYEERGDGVDRNGKTVTEIWQDLDLLLMRFRDPSVA